MPWRLSGETRVNPGQRSIHKGIWLANEDEPDTSTPELEQAGDLGRIK